MGHGYVGVGGFDVPARLNLAVPLRTTGSSQRARIRGVTLSGLRLIGASMPQTYIYMCRGSGKSASPAGADCAATGGPDTPDETNTSPRPSSQGMVYLENASSITIRNCVLRAGGIAGFWFEEAVEDVTVEGNWVQDFAGFGLYANGIDVGDLRYSGAREADVNRGHTIHNNLFVDGGRQIVYGTGVWLYQVGSTSITHNVIHRFPRDGVGFYGMLPFWTARHIRPPIPSLAPFPERFRKCRWIIFAEYQESANPSRFMEFAVITGFPVPQAEPRGAVAPGMPAATPGTRTPWGRYVSWNGGVLANGNASWSTWDILFNKNNYLAWNDVPCRAHPFKAGTKMGHGAGERRHLRYS